MDGGGEEGVSEVLEMAAVDAEVVGESDVVVAGTASGVRSASSSLAPHPVTTTSAVAKAPTTFIRLDIVPM